MTRTDPSARRRGIAWIGVAVLAAILLAVGVLDTADPTPDQRARRLETMIRCPECRGQSVAQSEAPSAKGVKTVIRDLIDSGRSDEEIRDHLVASYGREIVLDPEGSGFSALVWAIPVVVVLVALAALVHRFRDWRPGTREVTEDDRELVASAMDHPDGGDDR